jgi:antitoxin ParD1/3/4
MQMATRTTLNVSLPVELGHFIAAKIASGRYASASEVVRAGLRLLEASEAQSFADSPDATRGANRSAHDPADIGSTQDAR